MRNAVVFFWRRRTNNTSYFSLTNMPAGKAKLSHGPTRPVPGSQRSLILTAKLNQLYYLGIYLPGDVYPSLSRILIPVAAKRTKRVPRTIKYSTVEWGKQTEDLQHSPWSQSTNTPPLQAHLQSDLQIRANCSSVPYPWTIQRYAVVLQKEMLLE